MTYAQPDRTTEPRPAAETVAVAEERRAGGGWRIFQLLAAAAGAALFALGLAAVFQVDFGERWLQTTAEVAGIGFGAVAAIAAVLLGGAILVATLADQDRGSASAAGLVTLVVGIAGFVVQDNADADVQVDGSTATLFVAVGAVVFVLALVPWWSRRRRVVGRRADAY